MTATTGTPRRRRAQRGSGEQLRAEIVAAAKHLLASTGRADDVSVRAVADAVGVTSPSIYLHFADKNELIAAVVADVFEELDATMLAAAEGLDDPLERLRAFGMAYVHFAITHPEHYRLAAMDPCPMPEVDRVLQSSGFEHLHQTVIDCMAAGLFEKDDPLPVALHMWSAAHGIASLMIVKPFLPWGDVDALVDRVLGAAALGHAARGLLGGHPTPADVAGWIHRQKGS
jgi:AcrR family transcriptional regulator